MSMPGKSKDRVCVQRNNEKISACIADQRGFTSASWLSSAWASGG
jgi:hypothetical protein